MIHLDNFLLSHAVDDAQKRQRLVEIVGRTGKPTILNPYLLHEISKHPDKQYVKAKIDLLWELRNLRTMIMPPLAFRFEEVRWLITKGHPITAKEFKKKFTKSVKKRAQLDRMVDRVERDNPGMIRQLDEFAHVELFGKMTSQYGIQNREDSEKQAGKKLRERRIGDFFSSAFRYDPAKGMDFEFYRRHHDKFAGKGHDTTSYQAYQEQILRSLEQTSFSDLRRIIINDVRRFQLDFDKVCKWTISKYLRRYYFLNQFAVALPNLTDCQVELMKSRWVELRDMPEYMLPGTNLVYQVASALHLSLGPSKASTILDKVYLFIAPYMDLFVCDKDIRDKAQRANRTLGLPTEFTDERRFYALQ